MRRAIGERRKQRGLIVKVIAMKASELQRRIRQAVG